MLARELYELLSTRKSAAGLRAAVVPAIPAYRDGLAERGRSGPIDMICDGSLLVLAASHIDTLCTAFLDGLINEDELSYIATALDRAADFQFVSKEVEECSFFLSHLETNGTPLADVVPAVLRALREHAA